MKNDFKLYLLVLLLLTQEVRTRSILSQEAKKYSKRGDNEQENAELRETHKSKHKYKTENDHTELKRYSGKYENSEWSPQCAVMYKNNEPVGILQPFEDAFKFRPLKLDSTIVDLNPIPAKRRTVMDVLYPSKFEDDSDEENFSDEKVGLINKRNARVNRNYALALAKFKINSRMGSSNLHPRLQREKEVNEQHLRSLRNTLNKRKTDDSEAVEVELEGILNDMGLIDDSPGQKREVEDENMEFGANAVSMVKDEPNLTTEEHTKVKRDELETPTSTTPTEGTSNIELTEVSDIKENKEEQKKEMTESSSSTNISNLKEEQKREATEAAMDEQDADEVSVYEKRVEREIRDKIQILKEEVKKEIDALKLAKSKGSDPNRKKRDVVSTLMDEETQEIDPVANYDGTEKEHVRRKRSAQLEERYGSVKYRLNKGLDKTKRKETERYTDYYDNYSATGTPHASKKRYSNSQGKRTDNIRNSEYDDKSKNMKVIGNERSIRKSDHFLNGIRKQQNLHIVDGFRKASNVIQTKTSESQGTDKRQDMYKAHIRTKREAEDYAENGYDEAYEELVDDTNSLNENRDMTLSAQEKPNCRCDKNGNNCKCGKQAEDADYSNFIVDPERVIRSAISSNQHCHCDKNHNCKCEMQEAEPASEESRRQRREGSLDQSQYQLIKREARMDSPLFKSGEYFVDLHPTMYRLIPDDSIRSKREMNNQQKDLTSSFIEEPQMTNQQSNSLRDEPLHSRIRRTAFQDADDDQRQLIDMSEEEIFGALPQGFEGELQRYKRIRR